MKISATILAFAACAATAAAFTIVPSWNSVGGANQQTKSPLASSTRLHMSAKETIESAIESNDVVIFSKSYCPFCTKTKDLFKGMGVDAKIYELDEIGDDGPEYQMTLMQMTGQRTVPNVFVKGQHIGGNDDSQAAAKDGKLKEMLGL